MQIMCNTLSAYSMQHTLCLLVQRNSSASKLDGVEIAFILALFYWLNLLTHFVPQTRLSRFQRDIASASKQEALVLDRTFISAFRLLK